MRSIHQLFAPVLLLVSLSLSACGILESPVAIMHTDVPEMAIYAAAFNISQNRYKIHASFEENLPESLTKRKDKPSLAIGRYLKSAESRAQFQSLDYLFTELVINQSAFYPSLLEQGNLDGRQVLLPVSFNLPLILFDTSRDKDIQDNFIIDIDEIRALSASFNKKSKESYTNMGFAPRWYPDFMYELLRLNDANFIEGNPLKWNKAGIDAGMAYLREWSTALNGSALDEDDFQFKYLYLPEHRSVQEGRIAFSYMDSSRFFSIPEERRASLAFRWLAKDGAVPVADNPVFAGILRASPAKSAAEAFLKWFFSEETQRTLLEDARRYRSMESAFGLAGGFSSIRSVNEKSFPLYYPSLLGKMPPASYLQSVASLPSVWPLMKSEVLLPLLLEATGGNPQPDIHAELEKRLAAWFMRRGRR
jgi:ABC-type glycerol-3-phosphate transport system substrate-binding protein